MASGARRPCGELVAPLMVASFLSQLIWVPSVFTGMRWSRDASSCEDMMSSGAR